MAYRTNRSACSRVQWTFACLVHIQTNSDYIRWQFDTRILSRTRTARLRKQSSQQSFLKNLVRLVFNMPTFEGRIILQYDRLAIIQQMYERQGCYSYNSVACVSTLKLLDTVWKKFEDCHTKICETIELTGRNLAHGYFSENVYTKTFSKYIQTRDTLLRGSRSLLENVQRPGANSRVK